MLVNEYKDERKLRRTRKGYKKQEEMKVLGDDGLDILLSKLAKLLKAGTDLFLGHTAIAILERSKS